MQYVAASKWKEIRHVKKKKPNPQLICQPFLINSLHSNRTEVGSSSDQSTNYSGKTAACCMSWFCMPFISFIWLYYFILCSDKKEGDVYNNPLLVLEPIKGVFFEFPAFLTV